MRPRMVGSRSAWPRRSRSAERWHWPVAFVVQAPRKPTAGRNFANTGGCKEISLSNARTRAPPRIVSDEDNSLARRPTIGSRRVSMLVAVPVVAGCAVLGSIIGTTHPLQSMFPPARLIDAPAATGPQDTPRGPASLPSLVPAVSTGSVDRPQSPGGSGDVAATQGDRRELVPAEGTPLTTNPSRHQARAKRLRRMLGRRTRPKPVGAQVDAFISSILPTK